ncbi:GIY-YIG nuclease family protein [Aquimarina sediminis]|uniref:GIY-YIG nuclease family protein n=1 Tax=Aquimarina sediminis TaxID=2070536 RepID=UPI000CA011A0|nr:GIY-YIG nuclease family protein [Aquimarina sediminis]
MSKMILKWRNFNTPYNKENIEQVPNQPGIYLIWVKLKNGNNWKCIYVGQTIDIRKRLFEHLSDNEDNECIKNNISSFICGFEYALVSNSKNRDNIEKYIYNQYLPECNQISPPSLTPQEVNLP